MVTLTMVALALVATALPGRVRRELTAIAPWVALSGVYLERRSHALRRMVHRTERRLVRETRVESASLILPLFVREALTQPEPIAALPGHRHETSESLIETAAAAVAAGCGAVLVFGLPEHKDAEGSAAWAEGGGVQQGIRAILERTCISALDGMSRERLM